MESWIENTTWQRTSMLKEEDVDKRKPRIDKNEQGVLRRLFFSFFQTHLCL